MHQFMEIMREAARRGSAARCQSCFYWRGTHSIEVGEGGALALTRACLQREAQPRKTPEAVCEDWELNEVGDLESPHEMIKGDCHE